MSATAATKSLVMHQHRQTHPMSLLCHDQQHHDKLQPPAALVALAASTPKKKLHARAGTAYSPHISINMRHPTNDQSAPTNCLLQHAAVVTTQLPQLL